MSDFDGIKNPSNVFRNQPTPMLYEEAIRRSEGIMSHLGPLVVNTGKYTGRIPQAKYFVQEPSSEKEIWWGKFNQPISELLYQTIKSKAYGYLRGKDLFVQDCYAGADPKYRLKIRVISESALHALFARTILLRELDLKTLAAFTPDFTIVHTPYLTLDPAKDGTKSDAFILVHFGEKIVLIGGTQYAGEIKKSVFTIMNYLMPHRNVLPMHCSANYGKDENDVAIFFGLSGTGKTTLSADSTRTLIGDDEHGWSDNGVFNFEGGCYAKVIKLSKDDEPEIYETTRRFGTILENVRIHPITRRIDLDDASLTENTRASYPISHIPNMTSKGTGGHPKHILLLTCDAFGILPPISRLSKHQAMYHFLAGYTAKIAGTEAGIKEPQATFSPCFGGPFMPMSPTVYAKLLGDRIEKYKPDVWLVNTGWSGAPCGKAPRIKIAYSRAMVNAALEGKFKSIAFSKEAHFSFEIPQECPDVPKEILDPAKFAENASEYGKKANELVAMFNQHILKTFPDIPSEIANAAPKMV